MKNRIIICILTITMLLAITMFSGCISMCGINSSSRTIGDFVYRYKEGYVSTHIEGISKAGKEKSVLVIPSHILDEVSVTSMGTDGLFGYAPVGNLESENLRKLFISNTIKEIAGIALLPCQNLEYIVIDCNENIETLFYIRSLDLIRINIILNTKKFDSMVTEAKLYDRYTPTRGYEWMVTQLKLFENNYKQPNVEFYLNYETEEPLFWFDYETGEYVQKHYEGIYTPTREGYTFAGWYKEPECLTEWNFAADRMPQFEEQESITAGLTKDVLPTGEARMIYRNDMIDRIAKKANEQERLRLYAKWI